MKTHLNTPFVTTEGTYLGKEGGAVAVKHGDKKPLRVPIPMLESIVCLAPVNVSPYLMALCAERGVSISFMRSNGRYLARVEGRVSGNVLLRKDQFRASENPDRALDLAQTFVQAKIYNSRVVVGRAIRDHGDQTGELQSGLGSLSGCQRRAEAATRWMNCAGWRARRRDAISRYIRG